MEGETLHNLEDRVLIVAPFGRDAAETRRVLGEAGFEAVECADGERLCAETARGAAAAAVVAEEALSDEDRRRLSALLAEQPAWSDLPLLMLTSQVRGEGDGWHVLRGIEGTAHLTLLERPLRVPTLVSAVRAAVESRRRQYQVRDELAARERAQESLRESRKDFARAQEVGQIGSWRMDVRRNVLTWSDESYRIFGVPKGTPLTYETFLHAVHPDDREHVDAQWNAGLGGEPYDIEHRIVVDGRVKWVREKAFLEFDESRNVLGGFGITQDITERKKAEEALRELNESLEAQVAARTAVAERRARALRRLAAELNEAEHRERTRLAKLLHDDLQQLLLAAKLRLPVLAQGTAEEQARHVARIDELLGDCLATSRNLSHELSPPILQCGTLSEVMDWLAEWFGEKHGLSVAVRAEGALPPVPEHLRVFLFQAVRELLTNVVKHSGRMEARVELSSYGGNLTVRVEDDGVGCDPEAVELSLERPEGFGLFNIQERLEALGGRLEIDDGPRGGARFRMIVPVAEAAEVGSGDAEPGPAEPASSPAPASHARDGAVRLLVVDDHAVVREGFANLLGLQPDFEVIGEADDGRQAVEQAEFLRPDAILMDVDMPTMNGVEATRRIKDRHPGVVIVGLSLHEEQGVARAMLEAGADAYVSKNSPAKDVVETVRRACRWQEGEAS